MDRKQLVIGLELVVGLVFVGLGHYYISSLREVYPLDGYILYASALVMFVLVWRAGSRGVDPRWTRLRSSFQSVWIALLAASRLMWAALRELLPSMSARTRVAIVFALNVLAAIVALSLPAATWLWLILWVVSIAFLLAMLWPQARPWLRSKVPARSPAGVAVAPDTRVLVEPAETIGPKPKLIGLGLAVVLLVIGQIVSGSVNRLDPSPAGGPSTGTLNETLKLGLPGDPSVLLAGGLLLLLGLSVFAWVTRRNGLSDVPRFKADTPIAVDSRLSRRWLLIAVAGVAIWLTVPKSIIDGATGWGGVLPWIAALVLIGLCWWRIDRARGVRLAIHIDRPEAIGLGLATLAILIVFVFRLGDVPNSLWPDEAAFFSMARDISRGAFTPDFFGLGTYGYPMGGSIYQGVWISLFGANVWAWRLSSVIAALLAIIPIYFLVRATLGRRVAGLSIALCAVSPYLLTYARMGYNNVQAIAPLASTLVLTWLAVRRNSRLLAFLAGCAGGLGFFTYTAARLGFVLALGGLVWVWITRRANGRSILMQVACVLLGVVLVATPTIVYGSQRYPVIFADRQAEALFNNVFYARDLYPEQDLYSSFGSIRVGNQDLFYEPGIYATLLGRGIVRTALSFNAPALVRGNYLIGALSEPYSVFY
ncbi:MAG TPA: glycosyltransferase family 39 protein, partial [Anaerolineae bacterium]